VSLDAKQERESATLAPRTCGSRYDSESVGIVSCELPAEHVAAGSPCENTKAGCQWYPPAPSTRRPQGEEV